MDNDINMYYIITTYSINEGICICYFNLCHESHKKF